MKRQLEVTVVLAILAVIYLPLTLVTGIFRHGHQQDEPRSSRSILGSQGLDLDF